MIHTMSLSIDKRNTTNICIVHVHPTPQDVNLNQAHGLTNAAAGVQDPLLQYGILTSLIISIQVMRSCSISSTPPISTSATPTILIVWMV